MVDARVKGSYIKNVVIGILIVLLFLLYTSKSIDAQNRQWFWFATGAGGGVFLFYYLFFYNKKRMDYLLEVSKKVVQLHYETTGEVLRVGDLQMDRLDAENFTFSYESAGNLISYNYNLPLNLINGRLFKKIDAIKDEVNKREIMKSLAAKSLQRDEERKIAEKHGFEIVEDGEWKNEE